MSEAPVPPPLLTRGLVIGPVTAPATLFVTWIVTGSDACADVVIAFQRTAGSASCDVADGL